MLKAHVKFVGMLIAIGVLTMAHSAFARKITTLGSSSCNEWTVASDAVKAKKEYAQIRALGMRSWVMGYMSALNAASLVDADILDNIDGYAIYDWMDKYCRANPEKSMSNAAQELFERLEKIARKKK